MGRLFCLRDSPSKIVARRHAIWDGSSEYGRALLYRTRFLGHKFVSCGGPE